MGVHTLLISVLQTPPVPSGGHMVLVAVVCVFISLSCV